MSFLVKDKKNIGKIQKEYETKLKALWEKEIDSDPVFYNKYLRPKQSFT